MVFPSTNTASETVSPVNERVDVIIGYTGRLQLYVTGIPLITSKEIIWSKRKALTTNDDRRILLTNFNWLLTIRNVGENDNDCINILNIGKLMIAG